MNSQMQMNMNYYNIWLTNQLDQWALSHKDFEESKKNSFEKNRTQLRRILIALKDTDHGKKHRIGELLNASNDCDHHLVSLFSKNVPVSTYDEIADAVSQMIEQSKSNILIPSDAVALYSETTGTTGTSKRFVVNKSMLEIFRTQINDQSYVFYQHYPMLFDPDAKELFLYCKEQMKVAADGRSVGSISMYAHEILRKYRNYLDSLEVTNGSTFDPDSDFPPIWRYSSPSEVYEVSDQGQLEPYYLHALFALKNRAYVRSITSVFIANILLLFDIIQRYWKHIVHDIRTAKVDVNQSPIWRTISESKRNVLFELLQPADEQLAASIESIMNGPSELASGWGKLLFPNLLFTQSCSAGIMEHYCDKLAVILGNDVECFGENYSASEGILGIHDGYMARNRFHHAVQYCYCELLPADQWFENHPTCISIDEAKIGQHYELVVTNLNGLYRYRMGDIIEYVTHHGVHGPSPQFRLLYRRATLLNFFGEKVTEQQLLDAIIETLSEMDEQHIFTKKVSLVDYCTTSNSSNGVFYHTIFVELTADVEVNHIQWNQFTNRIDQRICAANHFYLENRQASFLESIKIRLCRIGTFCLMKQRQMAQIGRAEQFKVPRFISSKSTSLLEFMLNNSIDVSTIGF